MRELLLLRQDGAFPIPLSHHPRAFDVAAESGVLLTLSGHTHGGQWMVTEQVGLGPEIFRYWSGLYSRGSRHLVVSNGVGNVVPLRINAPAEVVHLTLRRLPARDYLRRADRHRRIDPAPLFRRICRC